MNSSNDSSDGSFDFINELLITTSTPAKPLEKGQLRDKTCMHNFLNKLIGVSMSNQVLADIVIKDDQDYNTINIVGRPQVLGSASKQMRHVTPDAFITEAIRSKVEEVGGNQSKKDITNFAKEIVYTLLPLNIGICLGDKQYKTLKENLDLESESYNIRMTTTNAQNQSNVYYLISDDEILAECESLGFNTLASRQEYNKRFHKYIMYGLSYLEQSIEDAEGREKYNKKILLLLHWKE